MNKFVEAILSLKGVLYIAGNGGSAAISDHLACDLIKVGVRAISLASNSPVITMIANDYGYEHIFSFQLNRLLKPEDMVLLISSSGKSPNVVNAANHAKRKGNTILSFTGFTGDKLKAASDINHHVDLHSYAHVEVLHSEFAHNLARLIGEKTNHAYA
jgi:D-sedoheptulose 7-phosphate isomerase